MSTDRVRIKNPLTTTRCAKRTDSTGNGKGWGERAELKGLTQRKEEGKTSLGGLRRSHWRGKRRPFDGLNNGTDRKGRKSVRRRKAKKAPNKVREFKKGASFEPPRVRLTRRRLAHRGVKSVRDPKIRPVVKPTQDRKGKYANNGTSAETLAHRGLTSGRCPVRPFSLRTRRLKGKK